MLSTCKKTGHVLTTTSPQKQTQASSSGFIRWSLPWRLPQPEKSGFSPPPFSFLTDLCMVLFQTQHVYRWLLLWMHWVYETPLVARAPVDEAKKKPSHGRWNSPSNNTVVCKHSILQGIFSTQGLNLGLLNCRQILYHLSQQGSPTYLYQSINYIEETPWLLAHVLPFLQFSKGWCYNCTSLSSHHHHHNNKKNSSIFSRSHFWWFCDLRPKDYDFIFQLVSVHFSELQNSAEWLSGGMVASSIMPPKEEPTSKSVWCTGFMYVCP